MTQLAITVLGHDRPGIIAEATRALADLGMNIEDSTMTLLRGHFAMMLIGGGTTPAAEVEQALAGLTADGSLSVSVREVPVESVGAAATYLLSVHGGDRPGIVSRLVGEVAAIGGNVTDLSTRLAGDLYVLTAEVAIPEGVDVAGLEGAVKAAAQDLGVGASLRPIEADDL